MLQRQWYRASAGWAVLLSPLAQLYGFLAERAKARALRQQWRPPVPLIIVGNIAVGGTGKSPLTISLIDILRQLGYRPGVVSRGYGGKSDQYPLPVDLHSSPLECGDEPLMIVKRTGVPLVVAPDRVAACQMLLQQHACNIIISDDGLQHYKMGRDIEIVVIDGQRGLGNAKLLPVGPLRELPQRLDSVDYCIVNGDSAVSYPHQVDMHLQAVTWYRVVDQQCYSLDEFLQMLRENAMQVQGIAGIGNPQRFFDTLSGMGINAQTTHFDDHHQFSAADFTSLTDKVVCMTEKDAVKCRQFAHQHCYYLSIDAQLPDEFVDHLAARIKALISSK